MNPKEIIEKFERMAYPVVHSNAFPEKDVEYLLELSEYLIQTIISLYEQELKEIGEDEPLPFNADRNNPMKHCYQNEGYLEALQDLRQSIQSKLDRWNELLVNSK